MLDFNKYNYPTLLVSKLNLVLILPLGIFKQTAELSMNLTFNSCPLHLVTFYTTQMSHHPVLLFICHLCGAAQPWPQLWILSQQASPSCLSLRFSSYGSTEDADPGE